MFKNLIDSFLVIDAKEKPAPSFLMAYVFTWFVWHNEVPITFLKTKGDFTTRFNAGYFSLVENQWMKVIFLTFGFIAARFIFNSIIYYAREYIESKTQSRLNDKGHKSFIRNEVYQKLTAQVSSIQNELLASQDREKNAKAAENESTSQKLDLELDLDKYKTSYKTEQEINIDLKNRLDKEISMKLEAQKNLSIAEKTNTSLQTTLDKLGSDNLELRENHSVIIERLDVWGSNLNDKRILTLMNMNKSKNEDVSYIIEQILKSKIVFPDESEKQLNMVLDETLKSDYRDNTSHHVISKAIQYIEEEKEKLK